MSSDSNNFVKVQNVKVHNEVVTVGSPSSIGTVIPRQLLLFISYFINP